MHSRKNEYRDPTLVRAKIAVRRRPIEETPLAVRLKLHVRSKVRRSGRSQGHNRHLLHARSKVRRSVRNRAHSRPQLRDRSQDHKPARLHVERARQIEARVQMYHRLMFVALQWSVLRMARLQQALRREGTSRVPPLDALIALHSRATVPVRSSRNVPRLASDRRRSNDLMSLALLRAVRRMVVRTLRVRQTPLVLTILPAKTRRDREILPLVVLTRRVRDRMDSSDVLSKFRDQILAEIQGCAQIMVVRTNLDPAALRRGLNRRQADLPHALTKAVPPKCVRSRPVLSIAHLVPRPCSRRATSPIRRSVVRT